jgi:hypothetical protein
LDGRFYLYAVIQGATQSTRLYANADYTIDVPPTIQMTQRLPADRDRWTAFLTE